MTKEQIRKEYKHQIESTVSEIQDLIDKKVQSILHVGPFTNRVDELVDYYALHQVICNVLVREISPKLDACTICGSRMVHTHE